MPALPQWHLWGEQAGDGLSRIYRLTFQFWRKYAAQGKAWRTRVFSKLEKHEYPARRSALHTRARVAWWWPALILRVPA